MRRLVLAVSVLSLLAIGAAAINPQGLAKSARAAAPPHGAAQPVSIRDGR